LATPRPPQTYGTPLLQKSDSILVNIVPSINDLSDWPGTRNEIAARGKAEVEACAKKFGVTARVLETPITSVF